jgi:hypothetical protein
MVPSTRIWERVVNCPRDGLVRVITGGSVSGVIAGGATGGVVVAPPVVAPPVVAPPVVAPPVVAPPVVAPPVVAPPVVAPPVVAPPVVAPLAVEPLAVEPLAVEPLATDVFNEATPTVPPVVVATGPDADVVAADVDADLFLLLPLSEQPTVRAKERKVTATRWVRFMGLPLLNEVLRGPALGERAGSAQVKQRPE